MSSNHLELPEYTLGKQLHICKFWWRGHQPLGVRLCKIQIPQAEEAAEKIRWHSHSWLCAQDQSCKTRAGKSACAPGFTCSVSSGGG